MTSLTAPAPNMILRIVPRRGKAKDIPVETLNQASAIWDRLRLEKMWRSSTAPKGLILVDGIQRAWVSLNGRIWEGEEPAASEWTPGRTPVFDPSLAA